MSCAAAWHRPSPGQPGRRAVGINPRAGPRDRSPANGLPATNPDGPVVNWRLDRRFAGSRGTAEPRSSFGLRWSSPMGPSTRPSKRLLAAVVIGTGLTACAGPPGEPKILSGSQVDISILSDLRVNPRPIASAHCAKFQRRAVLSDTAPAADNLIRGWATGTKVFVYTFDCM